MKKIFKNGKNNEARIDFLNTRIISDEVWCDTLLLMVQSKCETEEQYRAIMDDYAETKIRIDKCRNELEKLEA